MKTLAAILLLTGCMCSQDCPVKVVHVSHTTSYGVTGSSMVWVMFKNDSEKEVDKSDFAVNILDSAGEGHPLLASFDTGKNLKPGKKTEQKWWVGREILDPFTKVDYKAWVKTVQFTDGSAWKDDGSHTCSWVKQ